MTFILSRRAIFFLLKHKKIFENIIIVKLFLDSLFCSSFGNVQIRVSLIAQ